MYSRAKNAAVAETLPPGGRSAALSLVDDFHKIGINEGHLHLWASRGPSGCTKQGPLLSPDYVKGVASARRGVLVEGMIKGVSRGWVVQHTLYSSLDNLDFLEPLSIVASPLWNYYIVISMHIHILVCAYYCFSTKTSSFISHFFRVLIRVSPAPCFRLVS